MPQLRAKIKFPVIVGDVHFHNLAATTVSDDDVLVIAEGFPNFTAIAGGNDNFFVITGDGHDFVVIYDVSVIVPARVGLA